MSATTSVTSEKIIRMPTCSWCARTILPGEGAVKFPCPSCGEVTIWRCEKCRMFGRPYRCVKCGYTGP